jgi:hypothetical protein
MGLFWLMKEKGIHPKKKKKREKKILLISASNDFLHKGDYSIKF